MLKKIIAIGKKKKRRKIKIMIPERITKENQ
jgi:hypothetical protein